MYNNIEIFLKRRIKMNKFKKKLLKILILTAISASSINCFAMEQNSKNIFNNNQNQYFY